MYHSIELRTPFVDYFLLKDLKYYMKYLSECSNKAPLVNSSKTKIPTSIIKRKKTGFNIPVKSWIEEIIDKDDACKNKSYYNLIDHIIKNIYKKSNISLG